MWEACSFWFPGRFNDPHRDDVLVSLARAQTHSEESFLLDGRTGTELWHRTVGSHFGPGPEKARAFGGGWMAILDHDGDGLDDILTMFPDGILVVQGSTGKTLLDRQYQRPLLEGSIRRRMDLHGDSCRG